MAEEQDFFTGSEAARYLRFSPATLAIWRSQGYGPAYFKIGHSVRYRRADLQAWATKGDTERRRIVDSAECHRARRAKGKRARGRAGANQRARRLHAEPNCRDCFAQGTLRPAKEVDHILPLTMGGQDTDDNVRCLCRSCHAARTAEKRSSFKNNAK